MEITANALQTVEANQNVQFTDVAVGGNCSIMYRVGGGLVTLRGLTSTQCRARFKISFGANVAVPTDGTVADGVNLAIAINGEAIPTTTMISTPAAVDQFNNVFGSVYLDVPAGCCSTISVKNIGEQAADVQNANLIVVRTA
jgi:hypothetical protein